MKAATNTNLPAGITQEDLAFPKFPKRVTPKWRAENKLLDRLKMYKTERFGWVICSLHIRNAPPDRREMPARFYAISLEGEICRVGLGPHVTQSIIVYVTEGRKHLHKFLELRDKGAASAGTIRDRISTRRANTILRRSDLWSY